MKRKDDLTWRQCAVIGFAFLFLISGMFIIADQIITVGGVIGQNIYHQNNPNQ